MATLEKCYFVIECSTDEMRRDLLDIAIRYNEKKFFLTRSTDNMVELNIHQDDTDSSLSAASSESGYPLSSTPDSGFDDSLSSNMEDVSNEESDENSNKSEILKNKFVEYYNQLDKINGVGPRNCKDCLPNMLCKKHFKQLLKKDPVQVPLQDDSDDEDFNKIQRAKLFPHSVMNLRNSMSASKKSDALDTVKVGDDAWGTFSFSTLPIKQVGSLKEFIVEEILENSWNVLRFTDLSTDGSFGIVIKNKEVFFKEYAKARGFCGISIVPYVMRVKKEIKKAEDKGLLQKFEENWQMCYYRVGSVNFYTHFASILSKKNLTPSMFLDKLHDSVKNSMGTVYQAI